MKRTALIALLLVGMIFSFSLTILSMLFATGVIESARDIRLLFTGEMARQARESNSLRASSMQTENIDPLSLTKSRRSVKPNLASTQNIESPSSIPVKWLLTRAALFRDTNKIDSLFALHKDEIITGKYGQDALFQASTNGHLKIVRALISHGVEGDFIDDKHFTSPLIVAAHVLVQSQ